MATDIKNTQTADEDEFLTLVRETNLRNMRQLARHSELEEKWGVWLIIGQMAVAGAATLLLMKLLTYVL